ncbi:MAG: hypothetical protein IJW31_01030 [Lentisphaeria bacterium]|nr:hypothetical protein [Lentisphaeria bacterium]
MNKLYKIFFTFTLSFFVFQSGFGESFSDFLNNPKIKDFTGCMAYSKIEKQKRRDIYLINFSQLYANYGDNVDFTLRENAILLDKANMELMYGNSSVPPCRYPKGSRPILEAVVEKCRGKNDQETALNFMRFCRDLHKKRTPNQECVYGGFEEEMIDRGEILCEELARLIVALGEIANIPGRIILHTVGGHYTAELYIDGAWAYLDPRMGIYFLKKDGKIASVKDLLADPELVYQQSEAVKNEVVAYTTWDVRAKKCHDIYFQDVELNCMSYYSLADQEKYNFNKLSLQEATDRGLFYYNKFYGQLIKELTQK